LSAREGNGHIAIKAMLMKHHAWAEGRKIPFEMLFKRPK